MDLHMAYRASLVLIRLVMKRRCAGRREIHGRRVALQTKTVHVAANEQARIRRSVREMARGAALGLDGRVLVDERAGGLDVALGADRVLSRTNAEQVRLESTVGVVAVGAFDQPFIDPVMEWLRKGRLYVRMALVAKARLTLLEQGRLRFEFVYAVAAGATDKSFAMGGPLEVGVLTNMASEALRFHLFRRCLCELKDRVCHPAAFDVGLARPVAAFAGHSLAAVLQGKPRVRIIGKSLHLVLVADGAGFCSRVAGWAGSWLRRGRGDLRLRPG